MRAQAGELKGLAEQKRGEAAELDAQAEHLSTLADSEAALQAEAESTVNREG